MGLFDLFKKKTASTENETVNEQERLENFAEMLHCKLLFVNKPKPDAAKIIAEAKKYFSSIDGPSAENIFIFTFPDIKIELADATIPAQCMVAIPDENKNTIELPEVAFQQNWHWQQANEIARTCNYEVLVSDLMTRTLPYKERVTM